MKKILFLLVTICAVFACDPTHEDISNGGHITAEQLKEMSSVFVDIDPATGLNGNVITCKTSAPVNAKWELGGKEIIGNYAWKKMKIGEYVVTLTGLCQDGTVLTAEFPIKCDVITNKLTKYFIYGMPNKDEGDEMDPNGVEGRPFKPGAWDAAAMRFSANEGKFTDIDGKEGCALPYLSDDVYWGSKTLIFDISDATDDCAGRIMNGWWSARYDDNKDVKFTNGLWELPLTETIAKDCAQGNGGGGKDLDIMVTSGSCQINAIYYEE